MSRYYRMILTDAERDYIENGREIERLTEKLAELKVEKKKLVRIMNEAKQEIDKND